MLTEQEKNKLRKRLKSLLTKLKQGEGVQVVRQNTNYSKLGKTYFEIYVKNKPAYDRKLVDALEQLMKTHRNEHTIIVEKKDNPSHPDHFMQEYYVNNDALWILGAKRSNTLTYFVCTGKLSKPVRSRNRTFYNKKEVDNW